ncbi:hypothetical protein HAX54_015930 [Datura stramonium]|uniref:Uncharacterized protein n=1 Tax=Datura stramonium TaxID=4076 RepID=A0ABS8UK06_DATST|nr:hypothetical protein [Datura stramonium]
MAVGANTRKRGREHTSAVTTTAAMNPLISMQSQPQLIDLTQLHTPLQQQQQQQQQRQQTNVVSTGLQLAFGDQSHQQQHQLQQQQQQQQSVSPQSSKSSILFSILTEDFLASHIKKQQDEIDHFLQVQVFENFSTIFSILLLDQSSFVHQYVNVSIGRTIEAYVRGEKEAALSCADFSSGGINGEEAKREGSGGGESSEAERRARGACITTDSGGACVASKGSGTGSDGGDAASTAAAGYDERRKYEHAGER